MEIMTPAPGSFDHEFSLVELLGGLATERLWQCLAGMLGTGFRLCDAQGRVVLEDGSVPDGSANAEISMDIEAIGRLEAPVPVARLQAAVDMLELLLHSQMRYLMAAQSHVEQVSLDYQRLQHEHAALMKSELQYRRLFAELEERVKQQVETIKTAERQLYQAEKLASVGQLAAGMAHEINNPLGFIRSNLNSAVVYVHRMVLLKETIDSGDACRIMSAWKQADMDFVLEDFAGLLQESISGVDRVARIVADLKEFSNIDRIEKVRVDVNDIVRVVCNIERSQFGDAVGLELDLGELPPLLCQPGHMNQLLLNLLVNARQAIGSGHGVIRIETALAGQDIQIRVSDTGCGIPPGNLPRIFDPFFTTRDVGKGAGLGLAVCRDIVHTHGGRIDVESRIGEGTTFTVYLPVIESQH